MTEDDRSRALSRRSRGRALRSLVPLAAALTGLAALAALALARVRVVAHPSATSVAVFPSPGSGFASPRAQVAFRGLPPGQLGGVAVSGSKSGNHTGRVVADSDGQGASFIPDKPFTNGEQVTVKTSLPILGADGGSFRFRVAQPAGAVPYAPLPFAKRVTGDVQGFKSRGDLTPAAVKMIKTDGSTSDIFLAPQQGPVQNGVMILDGHGRLVWFKSVPKHDTPTDFRVQTLHGQPVLTWWQGYLGAGVGVGTGQIYDTSYTRIAEVRAGNGLSEDLHEFELTPQGTALITVYYPVWVDHSDGAPRREIVLDSIVQEIDISTGNVLFQWDSLDHVGLGDSKSVPPKVGNNPFDYFHVNAAREDSDGNLIISARNTWAAYKVDHRSGKVIWTLGGKHSTFRLSKPAVFAFQHDVRPLGGGDHLMTIFDDGAGPPAVHGQSRLLELSLDFTHRTAREVFERGHSPSLLANFEGNYQQLPGGSIFAGWGQQPYFTEYDSKGHVVLDGRFVDQNAHYRAYRMPWHGSPRTTPAVAVSGGRVYASWNGDQSTVQWRVLGGSSASSLSSLTTAPRSDFETGIRVASLPAYVAVQALDPTGKVLSTSRTISTKR